MNDLNDKRKYKPGVAHALSLGTQLAAGIAIFSFLGHFFDKKRGGGYAFTLLGIFLGLFYGGYEVWKVVRELNYENKPPDDKI